MNVLQIARPREPLGRVLVLGLTGAGFVVAFMLSYGIIRASIPAGFDAFTYWAVNPANPYAVHGYDESQQGFFTTPAYLMFLTPLHALPWAVFHGLVALGLAASLAWMCGPLTLLVLLLPPVQFELIAGNINLILGAAVLAGLRYPALFVVPLLTKVTPGIGLLWFVARREWRSLVVAVGVSGSVALVSFAIAPHLWFDWARLLLEIAPSSNPDGVIAIPFAVRAAAGAALVIAGGRMNQRWLAVGGSMLAVPVLWNWSLVAPVIGAMRRGATPGSRLSVRSPRRTGLDLAGSASAQ